MGETETTTETVTVSTDLVQSDSPFCLVNGHAFQLADYGSPWLFCPRCGDTIELKPENKTA